MEKLESVILSIFYRYFGRYDLKPVMREFKKFINCPLEPTLVRKIK